MSKRTSIYDLTPEQTKIVYRNLLADCKGIPWILDAFNAAWRDYEKGIWKFDGATFVAEHEGDFWEVAAFVHDWLNSIGYVGKEVDLYFLRIMMELKYSERRIFERCKWMQWTFLNTFWHKINSNFIADDIPKFLKK